MPTFLWQETGISIIKKWGMQDVSSEPYLLLIPSHHGERKTGLVLWSPCAYAQIIEKEENGYGLRTENGLLMWEGKQVFRSYWGSYLRIGLLKRDMFWKLDSIPELIFKLSESYSLSLQLRRNEAQKELLLYSYNFFLCIISGAMTVVFCSTPFFITNVRISTPIHSSTVNCVYTQLHSKIYVVTFWTDDWWVGGLQKDEYSKFRNEGQMRKVNVLNKTFYLPLAV